MGKLPTANVKVYLQPASPFSPTESDMVFVDQKCLLSVRSREFL